MISQDKTKNVFGATRPGQRDVQPAPLGTETLQERRFDAEPNDDRQTFPMDLLASLTDVMESNPARLGQFLMAAVDGGEGEWRSHELGAILRHQLSAPILFDCCDSAAPAPQFGQPQPEPGQEFPKSFRELFHHPSPPLPLLRLTKDFAKKNWDHPESALPRDVTLVLYYMSIVAAFVRHGECITKLDNEALRTGILWVIDQPWADESTKQLCLEGLRHLPAARH